MTRITSHRTRALFLPLVLALFLPAGCNDAVVQERRAQQQKLQAALDIIGEAEQGYVPDDGQTFDAAENRKVALLGAYRQESLDKAARALKAIKETGTADMKRQAAQLLAEIYCSKARYASRKAMADWAELSNASATLLSQLVALSQADSRVNTLNDSEDAVLQQVNTQQLEARNELNDVTAKIAALQTQIEQINSKITELQQQRDKGTGQAEALKTKAFTAAGPEQFQMQIKAIELQRGADKAAAEAEELSVSLEIFKSEHSVLQKRGDMLQKHLADVANQINVAQDRQADLIKKRQRAMAEREQLTEELSRRFDDLMIGQKRKVEDVLTAANGNARAGIAEAEKVIEALGGERDTHDAQFDLLSKEVTAVHTLYQQILVTGAFGDVISTVADYAQKVAPAKAKYFQENADQFSRKQQVLIEESATLLAKANALVESINTGGIADGSDLQIMVRKEAVLLQGYTAAIAEAKMNGG